MVSSGCASVHHSSSLIPRLYKLTALFCCSLLRFTQSRPAKEHCLEFGDTHQRLSSSRPSRHLNPVRTMAERKSPDESAADRVSSPLPYGIGPFASIIKRSARGGGGRSSGGSSISSSLRGSSSYGLGTAKGSSSSSSTVSKGSSTEGGKSKGSGHKKNRPTKSGKTKSHGLSDYRDDSYTQTSAAIPSKKKSSGLSPPPGALCQQSTNHYPYVGAPISQRQQGRRLRDPIRHFDRQCYERSWRYCLSDYP